MAIIATFKAYPITAFSDRPGGGNDPFVMSDNDTAQLLTVSIDDDDSTLEGDTIVNESPDDPNQIATVTDASGALVSTDACYVEWTATYTGTNGQVIEVWRIELDNGLRLFAMSEIPEEGITYNTSNKDQGASGLDPADIPDTPCFTRGTLIATASGQVPIETLCPGDKILRADGGMAVLRWIGGRQYGAAELAAKPALRPVCIRAGAMGQGLPVRDMWVSRQHRMLVRSRIAKRMFGTAEVLIPAIKLTTLPQIFEDDTVSRVHYMHMLFDRHEVVLAEGAPSESLYTGPLALNAVGAEARAEIYEIFPQLAEPGFYTEPARLIPQNRRQKQLIARHQKNRKDLVWQA